MAVPPPPAPETLDELNARIDLVELRVVRRDMEFRQHSISMQARGRALLSPSHWLRPVLGVGSGWLFWRLVRRRSHRHGRRGGVGPASHDTGRHDSATGGLGGLLTGLLGAWLGAAAPGAGAEGGSASGPHGHRQGGGGQGGSGGGAAGAAPHASPSAAKPEFALLQMLTMAWSFMPLRLRGSLGPETTQLLLGLVAGLVHGLRHQRQDRQEREAPNGGEAQAEARRPPGSPAHH